MDIENAIALADSLAPRCKCSIDIEDVAPVYVPAVYERQSIKGNAWAVRVFENGSVIRLHLLPF